MDNSILYGLRNPAMTEDIGMSMIERQYPTNITPLGYTPGNITNKSAYFNQPYADTFQTKREKEYSAIKKILVGLGLLALGIWGYKKGVKGIKNGLESIKNLFSKGVTNQPSTQSSGLFSGIKKGYEYGKNNVKTVFTKCKNVISNLFNKVKNKISP